jgi:hypothetical protein
MHESPCLNLRESTSVVVLQMTFKRENLLKAYCNIILGDRRTEVKNQRYIRAIIMFVNNCIAKSTEALLASSSQLIYAKSHVCEDCARNDYDKSLSQGIQKVQNNYKREREGKTFIHLPVATMTGSVLLKEWSR